MTPPGKAILSLDLEMPNSGTLLVLSTQPLLADPVLAFQAPGTNFFTHALGLNVMPLGKTTVIGLPETNVHAWFFVNDNSPGFAAETYDLSTGFFRAPPIPFVAGWSNGRHDPPENLEQLRTSLKDRATSPYNLLKIDPNASPSEQYKQLHKHDTNISASISLPDGDTVKVADLMALVAYDILKRGKQK